MGLTSVKNDKELELYIDPNLISTFKHSYLCKRIKDETFEEDLEAKAPQKRQKS